MTDLFHDLHAVSRSVSDESVSGQDGHVVELRRTYDAPAEDVWDACTDPERIARWFLPVSGDLQPGGRFQLHGNASGEITLCEPPTRLVVTWELGEMSSLVTLELAPVDAGATELRLQHAVADDEQWASYGPGAVGVGWDLVLLGLAMFIRTGRSVEDPNAFATSPEGLEFMRQSAADWSAAHAASGASSAIADEAAARTSEFYAPQPSPTSGSER